MIHVADRGFSEDELLVSSLISDAWFNQARIERGPRPVAEREQLVASMVRIVAFVTCCKGFAGEVVHVDIRA